MDNKKQLLKVKDMLIHARAEAIGLENVSLRYRLTGMCIDFIEACNLEESKNNSK